MRILCVFESDVFMVQTGLFLISNVENRFFAIHFYDLLNGDTGGYKGLRRVTRGYKGLQGVTKGYNGLQEVTKDYRKLVFLI